MDTEKLLPRRHADLPPAEEGMLRCLHVDHCRADLVMLLCCCPPAGPELEGQAEHHGHPAGLAAPPAGRPQRAGEEGRDYSCRTCCSGCSLPLPLGPQPPFRLSCA